MHPRRREHLATAAQDGWAILHLSPDEAAAVSIDTYMDGEASFTTMAPVVTPVVFEAASIVSYSLNPDDTLFSIAYRSLHADQLLVSLPTEYMRNCLPLMQAAMPARSSDAAITSCFSISPPWEMGTIEVQPLVYIKFADDRSRRPSTYVRYHDFACLLMCSCPDLDLDLTPQRRQKAHQPFKRYLRELAPKNLR